MEQTTTNGTVGILTLTWLIIKFGIACILAILIFCAIAWLIQWTISKVRKDNNLKQKFNNTKNANHPNKE